MDLKKNNQGTKNTRMKYPKPLSYIVSYFVLLLSFVLIMAVVYGVDLLIAKLAARFL